MHPSQYSSCLAGDIYHTPPYGGLLGCVDITNKRGQPSNNRFDKLNNSPEQELHRLNPLANKER